MSTCSTLLVDDHLEHLRLLDRLTRLLEGPMDWEALAGTASKLQQALLAHFVLEEQCLFPVLNPYRSMMLMEVEHDDLLALQKAFMAAVTLSLRQRQAVPNLVETFSALKERLLAHMREEEEGVFRLAETKLEPEEKDKVARLYAEHQAAMAQGEPKLFRPKPGYKFQQVDLFGPGGRAIAYQTLYEREQAIVQHVRLKAGQALTRHWHAQHVLLVMLSGQAEFSTEEETRSLEPGGVLEIDSRLPFALQALTNTTLLLFKVWPHPHYTKA